MIDLFYNDRDSYESMRTQCKISVSEIYNNEKTLKYLLMQLRKLKKIEKIFYIIITEKWNNLVSERLGICLDVGGYLKKPISHGGKRFLISHLLIEKN